MITKRKQIERLLVAEIKATEPDFGAVDHLISLLRKSSPGGVSLSDVNEGYVGPMNITVGHNIAAGQHMTREQFEQREAGEDNLATTLQGILQMQRLTASLEALRCLTSLGAGDPELLARAREIATSVLSTKPAEEP